MTSIYYEILTVELNDGKIYPVRPLLMKLGDREKCLYDKGTGECVGTYDEENVAIKQVKHEQRSDDSIEEPEEDSDDAEGAECSTAECSSKQLDESDSDESDSDESESEFAMINRELEKKLYDSNVQLFKHSDRLYKLEKIIRKIGEGVRIHLGEDEEKFVNTILEKPCPLPLQHLSPYQIQFGWWW